jgi:V/A-type H+/Na+-transporting ATPase subunit D
MSDVSPTRMNLLARHNQYKMARRGVELLEKKRDALVQEFFANVHEALEVRQRLYATAQKAHRGLMVAKAFDGPELVEGLSLGLPVRFQAQAAIDNVWGIRLPRLEAEYDEQMVMSPLAVGGRTIAAQAAFQELGQVLIEVANIDSRLRHVAAEIKKTARRVNALQQVVLPGIRSQIRTIQQALNQQEQEDIFRLKRIKNKIKTRKV